jgi:ubiquinone/menaquinone biosynthesis C-methylase UbiE
MYKQFALIYDDIMEEIDYQSWFDFIYGLSCLTGRQPETLLDLACGTGSFSVIADKKDIFVTALDNSEMMLAKAMEKSTDNSCEIEFLHQDMRRLCLPFGYELAVCLFDSINYITVGDELVNMIEKVYSSLQDGSLFVLDFAGISKAEDFAGQIYTEDNDKFIYIWKSDFCLEKKFLNVITTFFIKIEDNLYKRYDEEHLKRIYHIPEIESLLKRTSFTDWVSFSGFSFKPARKNSSQYVYVLGKGFKKGYLQKLIEKNVISVKEQILGKKQINNL